jgi:hypothetical protein
MSHVGIRSMAPLPPEQIFVLDFSICLTESLPACKQSVRLPFPQLIAIRLIFEKDSQKLAQAQPVQYLCLLFLVFLSFFLSFLQKKQIEIVDKLERKRPYGLRFLEWKI